MLIILWYNIIKEGEEALRKGGYKMFTQYSEEYDCWGIYKLVQKNGKIKAECLAVEWTKKAALRKMHELYEEANQ